MALQTYYRPYTHQKQLQLQVIEGQLFPRTLQVEKQMKWQKNSMYSRQGTRLET